MSSIQRDTRIRPQRLTASEIEAKAWELSAAYFNQCELPLKLMCISFDSVYEQIIYPDYGIILEDTLDLGFDEDGKKILGKYDPVDNVAYIDVSIHGRDPRRAFTCWHEVGGHGVLQGDHLRKEMKRLSRRSCVVTTSESLDLATVSALEWQANVFAANAAAPKPLLSYVVDQMMTLTRPIRYVGPGWYMLDIRGTCLRYKISSVNEMCRVIASHIQHRFGFLSVEALSYQIERLRYIIDVIPPKVSLHRVVPAPATTFVPQFSV